jgi:NarL family two-component system response regulator LiaR
MVRKGLATVMGLKEDLVAVGEARDGQEAIEMCERLQPDVVLMDLMMPIMDGTAATRIIRERWPQVQVIALTASQERNVVQGVLQAGAIGYLIKNVGIDELAQAIRSAHAGQPIIAPEAKQALSQSEGETPPTSAKKGSA